MTLDELIEEGRRLARPCVSLRDTGNGEPAAHWYPQSPARWNHAHSTGELLWLTVDLSCVPGVSTPPDAPRYLSVFTDQIDGGTGRVELTSAWPTPKNTPAVPLFGTTTAPLPPIDAIFARASDGVRTWLRENNWSPEWPYNSNFKDRALANAYERLSQAETPVYSAPDVYAVLGGWHLIIGGDDWREKIEQTLIVCTLADAEPWVEVWRDQDGSYSVIQRIT